jgi:hypothetical protein
LYGVFSTGFNFWNKSELAKKTADPAVGIKNIRSGLIAAPMAKNSRPRLS